MKRFLSFMSAMLVCIYVSVQNVTNAISFTPSFQVYSESVYMINLDTKSVIYEKNADMQQMPSSLVDIMTAIIVLEECPNTDEVTITADKNLYEEFESYEYQDDLRYAEIWDGDTLTVTDYLYALMLTSSCEAANILAYHFGNQNINSFVEKMNEKAQEIGAENTVFKNPHGLYDPKQLTTAKDMALITQYALTVPGFEDIATCEEYVIEPKSYITPHEGEWSLSHSNIIMSAASDYYLYGVKGIKTGNLTLSGRNIITMGSSDGIKYLLVLLNAPFYDENGDSKYYHIIDARNLMEWVFENFNFQVLLSKDEEIAEVKVNNSDGSGYVLVKPSEELSTLWYNDIDSTSIFRKINLPESVEAPVKKGDKLGEIELRLSDEVIDVIDLVAANDVDRSFIMFNLSMTKTFFSSKWFKIAIIISILLTALYTAICIWAYNDSKKRARGSFSNKKIVKKLYGNKRK